MNATVEKAVSLAAREASSRFGVMLPAGAESQLSRFLEEMLRWNRSVNLTSIDDPAAVGELHLLDSLAIVRHVPPGSRVLDVGTGGGFPGVPLALARPDVQVDMVDRTEKKILFLKSTMARLGVPNARAHHIRLEGRPEEENLQAYDLAVSRAFSAPPEWIRLARAYVRPGGRIIAMLGPERPDDAVWSEALGADRLVVDESYVLPSGARRTLLVVERS